MPSRPRRSDRRAHAPRRRLDVLYEVTRQLTAVQETDAVLALIVDEATRLLDVEAAALYLLEGDTLVLRAGTDVVTSAMSGTRQPVSEGADHAAARGEATVADAARSRAAAERGFQGFVAVPLRANAALIGVLDLYTRQ